MVATVLALGVTACGFGPSAPSPTPEEVGVTVTATPVPRLPPTAVAMRLTPTPEPAQPDYSNAAMGLSMWYPGGWIYQEEEERLIFASSEEVVTEGGLTTGAAMVVAGSGRTWVARTQDRIAWLVAEIAPGDEVATSDMHSRTIGGAEGLVVTFEGTAEGADVQIKGFVAGVESEDWQYLFVGVSALEEWAVYGTYLEAMLDSVEFIGHSATSPVPSPGRTPDRWEPDDGPAEAQPIEVGGRQTHDLHVPGDPDWVRFGAVAGLTYVIETSRLGGKIDTVLHLYDAQENGLASDEDRAGGDLSSRLEWEADRDGEVYVMVQDLRDSVSGPGTEYDLLVREK